LHCDSNQAYQKSVQSGSLKPGLKAPEGAVSSELGSTVSTAASEPAVAAELPPIVKTQDTAGVAEAAAAAAAVTPPLPPRQQQQLHKPAHFHQLSQGHYQEFAPRIVVIGVGGAGGNAVNNMIARNLHGVEFLVCNTDAQHLSTCLTENRLQLGKSSGEVRVSQQVYNSSLSMPYKLAQARQHLCCAV
jgi:hypothetical protein